CEVLALCGLRKYPQHARVEQCMRLLLIPEELKMALGEQGYVVNRKKKKMNTKKKKVTKKSLRRREEEDDEGEFKTSRRR
ncbi:unnamed protein product, partial [Rangifer tarandus platyrhynchus]